MAWELYRLQSDGTTVRANSKSNLKHQCLDRQVLKITDLQKNELTPHQRDAVSKKFAKILGEHPTVSLNSGLQILNEACSYISDLSIQSKKNLTINLSRKHVSRSQKEQAQEVMQANLEFFIKNYQTSSIVIDNWTGHG